MNRAQMLYSLEDMIDIAKSLDKDKSEPVFFVPNVEDLPEEQKLEDEYDHLGFFISSHPLDNYRIKLSQLEPIDSMHHKEHGEFITLGGLMMDVETRVTKKKTTMGFFKLEDLSGRIDVVLFPRTYDKFKDVLTRKNLPVQISGKIEKQIRFIDNGGEEEEISITKIILTGLKPLEETRKIEELRVNLNSFDNPQQLYHLLTQHPGDVNISVEYESLIYHTNLSYSQDQEAMRELESSFNVQKFYKSAA